MDEDAFLINSLNTDLLTAYAGASGDDEPPRRQRAGCLGALLIVVLAIAYALL